MKKTLSILSKVFYSITFFTFFLPCFVPSCGSKAESEKPVDSLEAVTMVDSSSQTVNSLSKKSNIQLKDSITITEPIDSTSTEEESPNRALRLLVPDGENFSLWGYLYSTLSTGFIWAYFILFGYSMVSRFRNQSNFSIAQTSSLSIGCLILAIYFDLSVVWGFWFLTTSTLISVIVNWIVYISETKQ